jgi:hypothetical protein
MSTPVPRHRSRWWKVIAYEVWMLRGMISIPANHPIRGDQRLANSVNENVLLHMRNFLEDVEYGLSHDPDEVQQKYLDPREDTWTLYVVPVLKHMRRRAELARSAGVSERFIQFLRNGGKRSPSRSVQAKLTRAAANFAREQLGPDVPNDDIAVCMAYVRRRVVSA